MNNHSTIYKCDDELRKGYNSSETLVSELHPWIEIKKGSHQHTVKLLSLDRLGELISGVLNRQQMYSKLFS